MWATDLARAAWRAGRLAGLARLLAALVLAALFSGCAVNPVTGKKELALLPESMEIEMGESNYLPGRQAAGGDYLLDPALTAYVNEVGQRLVAVADRKLPYEFVILNSSVPNAWAMPGGKIAINRGLLVELGNEAELAAVLSHEIVHAAARHGAKSTERGLLLQGAVLAVNVASRGKEYAGLADQGSRVAAGLIGQKYSREHELESDHYGMVYMSRAGYDPRAAISLQETFVRLAGGKKPGWLDGLFASHPPSQERVEANRALAATLPPGGELGEPRYRSMLARLQGSRAAYAQYDSGRAALERGDAKRALALVEGALSVEPDEALFFALRGDAHAALDDTASAVADYGEALARYGEFFYPLLKRGLLSARLGDDLGAKRDLEASLALLPTPRAHLGLGNQALAEGRYDNAKDHYANAADPDSEIGKEAYRALVRLDLPARPETYLRAEIVRDRYGQARVRVTNPTSLPVQGVVLELSYRQGKRDQAWTLALPDMILPGQGSESGLDLPPLDKKAMKSLGVAIRAAQLVDQGY